MEIKLKLPLSLAACLLTASANAATINVNNMAPNVTTNAGSVSGFTVATSALVDSTITFTLTQTANLDGGTIDDTLSFDLIYKAYTGSTFSAGDVTLGSAANPRTSDVNWHSGQFNVGNTLSLEVANISYTDGEGDETVAFNGFTEITPTAYGNPETTGTPIGNIDYYVGLAGATTIVGDPTFGADLTSNGTSELLYFTAAGGPVRLRNLDFQFVTVIPEPSSFAMLAGLTGLGFIMLRRRRV